jgi:hypothetical protein
MKITLIQSEIEQALKQYVASQGIAVTGKSIEVSITAGRGANGTTAELDIVDFITEKAPETPATRTTSATLSPRVRDINSPVSDVEDSAEIDDAKDVDEEPPAMNEGKSLFG